MSARVIIAILGRELAGYFASPLAFIFITIFLVLSGAVTFFLGGFLARGQADLAPFFQFHPWLYLFLIPALGMRLWAEERKTGTIEFLLTLPVQPGEAVVAKFLAAWLFAGLALILTFPIWIAVNALGDPDNGVILAGYLGSWMLAGGFLAIASTLSAATSNQVIAFVLAVTVSFVFMASGLEIVQAGLRGWAPDLLVDLVADLSLLSAFAGIAQGVVYLRDLVYFLSLIGVGLVINTALIEAQRER